MTTSGALTVEDALLALRTHSEPGRAEGMQAYHKVPRPYLGVPNPALGDLAIEWRRSMPLENRVSLADRLWATNIFEARIVAAKMLTQARITPDDAVWNLITGWLPDFDSWAIADHAMIAGQKRLMADLGRMDEVETWTKSDSHWIRRAAMIITLPLAKKNHPKADETNARERVLAWAGQYVRDPEWFIQKSVAWWLRDLSKRNPDRVRDFMSEHGKHMKKFARKEAEKYLKDQLSTR